MTDIHAPLRRAKSLTEQAAEQIRARIIRGDFELGAPLSENTLAAELGVSKTPVREALLQLKGEGLVSIQPQRGTFVFDMRADEIVHLGELREVLEAAALRAACERNRSTLLAELARILAAMRTALDDGDAVAYRTLDAQFHQSFFDCSGNEFLRASYLGIAFRIQALRTRLSVDPMLNRCSFDDHCALHDLIAADRVAEALDLLSRHVRGTVADYAASVEKRRRPSSDSAPA